MSGSESTRTGNGSLLVVSAHARDFGWRAGGAIALAAGRGDRAAARMALQARMLAQAIGYDAPGEPLGAPPMFFFEPHQPEQCDFRPEVLAHSTVGEAFVRLYPQVTRELS